MIEHEDETTQNELEIAIHKRNRKYQKPFKNGGNYCNKDIFRNKLEILYFEDKIISCNMCYNAYEIDNKLLMN